MERDYPLERVRNFGIIAHIDAGKTTTSERVLFILVHNTKSAKYTKGYNYGLMEQERERGITITAAAITCFWAPTYIPVAEHEKKENKFRFNIIDTPDTSTSP